MALLPGTARAQRHQAAALLHVDEERGSALFDGTFPGSLWHAVADSGAGGGAQHLTHKLMIAGPRWPSPSACKECHRS